MREAVYDLWCGPGDVVVAGRGPRAEDHDQLRGRRCWRWKKREKAGPGRRARESCAVRPSSLRLVGAPRQPVPRNCPKPNSWVSSINSIAPPAVRVPVRGAAVAEARQVRGDGGGGEWWWRWWCRNNGRRRPLRDLVMPRDYEQQRKHMARWGRGPSSTPHNPLRRRLIFRPPASSKPQARGS